MRSGDANRTDAVLRVIVTGPDGRRWVHRFSGSTSAIRVGRSSDNDVQCDDPRASRRQVVLRRGDDFWSVEDVSGRGTTKLNGMGIDAPTRLTPEDEVQFGQTLLEVAYSESRRAVTATGGETWTGEAVAASREDIHIHSTSATYRDAVRLARQVATSSETVLIRGETGTGKEVLARLIHEASPRAARPLVVINCPGLSESLFESELFGVEKGVATGVLARPGRLAGADGGTVLLDEIGDLPVASQAKILRFLQDRTVDRVGGTSPIPVDVRVLAATHQDLEASIESGKFRQDLYHRIAALPITVPPLRERRDDIPGLVEHFLTRLDGPAKQIDPSALEILTAYPYPGNVRELELAVRQAALLSASSVIGPEDLPERFRDSGGTSTDHPGASPRDLYDRVVTNGEDFWDSVRRPFLSRELSRKPIQELITRALAECGGSYAEAARLFRVEKEYRKFVDFLRHNQLRPDDR